MALGTPIVVMVESIDAEADVGRALEVHESIMAAMAGLVTAAGRRTGRRQPLVPPAGFEPALPA